MQLCYSGRGNGLPRRFAPRNDKIRYIGPIDRNAPCYRTNAESYCHCHEGFASIDNDIDRRFPRPFGATGKHGEIIMRDLPFVYRRAPARMMIARSGATWQSVTPVQTPFLPIAVVLFRQINLILIFH